MKLEEIRERSFAELQDEVTNLKKKLCSLRIDKGLQKEVDASEFGKTKKLIARIKTVIREKELAK